MGARAGFHLAGFATFRRYNHVEHHAQPLPASLDRERWVARQLRFLETVAQGSPQTEVVWNMEEVKYALDEIASSRIPERSAELVERLLRQTHDQETTALFQRALQSLGAAGAQ